MAPGTPQPLYLKVHNMDMENKIDDIELLAFTDPFNGLVHNLELLDYVERFLYVSKSVNSNYCTCIYTPYNTPYLYNYVVSHTFTTSRIPSKLSTATQLITIQLTTPNQAGPESLLLFTLSFLIFHSTG